MAEERKGITARALIIGALLCAVFSAVTVFLSNRYYLEMASTQIPVLPYAFLLAMVLLINPLTRLVRAIRPLTTPELLTVFIMGLVSAGIPIFGLAAQLVPVVGNLFNPSWNNTQSEWSRYVQPYVSETFFVAEAGIRDAAMRHKKAIEDLEHLRNVRDAALIYSTARKNYASAEAELHAYKATAMEDADNADAISRAESIVRVASRGLSSAQAKWVAISAGEEITSMPPEDAVDVYNKRITVQLATVENERKALDQIQARAFEKVIEFRRGLSGGLSAFPEVLPAGNETFGAYSERLNRTWHSWQALRSLREISDTSSRETNLQALDSAADHLRQLDNEKALAAEKEILSGYAKQKGNELERIVMGLQSLNEKRRKASQEDRQTILSRIQKLEARKKTIMEEQRIIDGKTDVIASHSATLGRLRGTAAEIRKIREELATIKPGASTEDLYNRVVVARSNLQVITPDAAAMFAGNAAWRTWLKPLLRWGILIALTYMVLMAFNLLIFRQWAHHEKLSYPLAQLPEELAGAGNNDSRILPPVFHSGLFWCGAAVSGGVLGWNLLCMTQAIPGLQPIDLMNRWKPFIENTTLAGLLPSAKSTIFFTLIGISFLVPQHISFSLWFFSLLYMAQLLFLVWLGYGGNEDSFPSDWWHTMNFRTAQGGGAILVFSSVVLWKCRRYIFCNFLSSGLRDLDAEEQVELRKASHLFVWGSFAIVLTLSLGLGAHPLYALVFYGITLLVTIGLIRAVTEGGVLGFQAWANPLHFIKTIFGMDKTWTSPALFSPLLVYMAVFFHDLKTFIAPAMANSIKIREDLSLQRRRFHIAVAAAIIIAVVVSLGTEIAMSYSYGADNMERWFHSVYPKRLFDQIATISRDPPQSAPFERGWMALGAGGMALLLYLRQTIFWLPHPIGLIMLVNPLMCTYWFSILLGWAAKSIVTRYGNKDTYGRAKNFFIGLIVGELILVILSAIFSIALKTNIGIDLNRNYF